MRFWTILYVAFVVLIAFSASPSAEDRPFEFDDAALSARYDSLIEELRCLVCQNQSLSDSNAELAQDLRDEVYRQLHEGHSDNDILSYMVARYGDFVLYRPPVKLTTILLWSGPALMFALGVVVVWRSRRAQVVKPVAPLDDQERARLQQLSNELDPPP